MNALTLSDISRRIGGTLLPCYNDRQKRLASGISTDSRTIKADELFFAIQGERFDGHDFVDAALKAGACAAVVTTLWYREHATSFDPHATFILVSDVLGALQKLGASYRSDFSLPIIGITGSSGKTTTKDMVAAVLSRRFRVLKTPGNLNSQIGVPQILCQISRAHDIAVLELGMNHAGEMARLAAMVKPNVGVITNVGPVHLEFLKSVEGVARAKGELLDSLSEDGFVILNADDLMVMGQRHRTHASLITFGIGAVADFRATDIESQLSGTTFRLADGPAFHLRIAGLHHVANALVAIAAGRLFQVPMEDIRQALEQVEPAAMRMDYQQIGGLHLINDAYNANPNSACAALQTLAGASYGRRIAVLGDMLELGAESEKAHLRLGRSVPGSADILITVGEQARHIAEGAREAGMGKDTIIVCEDNGAAIDQVLKIAESGDVVLVKGSRGMHMEEIVSRLEAHHAVAS